MTELEFAVRLAVALLAGLAVGLEREWSGHASGPEARFAGVRTFFLLGGIGGAAGALGTDAIGQPVLGAVLALGVVGLTLAAYSVAARRSPAAVDGTTEAAALFVVALGILAGLGWIRIAGAGTALAILALGEKDAVHRFVARIAPAEMRGALLFAVLALVVLPLIPEGPYDPLQAIRPRLIWTVVLVFSALSYIGYVARRMVGNARGLLVTGALGGLFSSTAVTLGFARQSRTEPLHTLALSLGVVAVCTVLVPRVVAVSLVLDPRFAGTAVVLLLPMAVTGVLLLAHRRKAVDDDRTAAVAGDRNPLELGQAIRLAVAFQVVLLGIEFAQTRFGTSGVFVGAALAGLTDVDALTLSMARLATESGDPSIPAQALVVGVVANTVLKTALAGLVGAPAFRRHAVPRLLAVAVVGAATVIVAAQR
ncbi:MAG: MgtC/SapB family protein [Gemmatimonadetes bacterium]|nr:MgtC/SapB family protein [Gemmatimonadota bacterium]